MKNSSIYYSVGALLYCPANNRTIVDSITKEKFGKLYSLALCLEDTINDLYVEEAEQILISSLGQIYEASKQTAFYLPKIFIRIRSSAQLLKVLQMAGDAANLICGFILPKFSLENADDYINAIIQANEICGRTIYAMPIYENSSIINLQNRTDILYALKEKLARIEELILNIRVGGNDLCHMFGFRRHDTESIHQIRPISNIFSDIITVYGMDYVISGAVWEYFNGQNWETGLIRELLDDRLCGFTGKTVIHPKQIAVVNNAYKVFTRDYEDAKSILDWDKNNPSLVSACVKKERMNEYKTHSNWALQTIFTAEYYGTK